MVQQTQEQQALQEAIEALYQTFARYPLREHIEGCECCVNDVDEAKLHAAPLDELTSEQLNWYAQMSLLTWGDLNDFKHFLPRFLELATNGECPLNIESLGDKIRRYGDYPSWPEAERQAVAAFCMAWWRALLAEFPTREWAINALGLFAHFLVDLRPFLDVLRETETLPARRHLFQVCDEVGDESILGPVTNWPWWCEVPDQAQQVTDWFFEVQTAYQLLRAIDTLEEVRWSDDADQHKGWSDHARRLKDMAQTILKTA